jgi:hypothetical protein
MPDIQNIIHWSSDGKYPVYDECVDDIHVYKSVKPENAICKCGKTKWIYEVCPHCNQKRGKVVLV